MPRTEEQLQRLIHQASTTLQSIQDELGRDGVGGKVRFPVGYLIPVHERMDLFNWIDDNTLRKNLCYQLMFTDVLGWLLRRTTLKGTARSMVIKHVIAVMGGIAEAVTFVAMRQLGHGKRNYAKRIERLKEDGIFSQDLADDLQWLWEARSRIHVHEVTDLELDAYDAGDGNRAASSVSSLVDRLRHFMIAREFDDLTNR